MQGMSGKGWWLRSTTTLAPTAAAAVAKLVRGGFRWIAPVVLGHGGADRRAPNRGAELWDAIDAHGLPAWPTWILPTPSTWRDEIEDFLDFASSVGAAGVIVDPEAEWRDQQDDARAFARALREGCDARELQLVVTTYGIPPGDFPLEEFGAVADAGIAQTYDRDLQFLRSKFTRSLSIWAQRGFRVVYPAAGMHAHARQAPKTAGELARHLALIPAAGAVVVWPEIAIVAALWRVLASWVPRRVGGAAGGAVVVLGLLGLLGLAAVARG